MEENYSNVNIENKFNLFIKKYDEDNNKLKEQLQLIYSQLEHVLIMQAKYLDTENKLLNSTTYLSSVIDSISSKTNTIKSILNDNDINVEKVDDKLDEVQQTIERLSAEIQHIQDTLTTMRMMRTSMVANNYDLYRG